MSDYKPDETYLKEAFSSARNSERIYSANRNIDDVRAELTKMRMIINAMWEVMKEQGVSTDVFNAKINEVIDRENAKKKTSYASHPMKPCPKCGKTIQELAKTPMRGRCLFCGQEVVFYPFMEEDGVNLNSLPKEDESDGLNI